ncbi:MAG: glutathione-regulated potassium-efflux system protein [Rhodospirillales bacterium]|jgi:CPA2 family monovalent cation:H+ antiporter-2|nr:glutathione-regulated potassium-efflux system protein [Rhodospirillales bacterium]
MADALLVKALIVIVASVATVGLLARIGLPSVLGYLVAGLLIGPHGLRLLLPSDETSFLAELGVIFLMFMVGLEFSLPRIIAARRAVFSGGLYVTTAITLLTCLLWLLGFVPGAPILVAAAAAMSSTAIALKQLSEQGELGTRHGQAALGILLFQDLAALPFLVAAGPASMEGQGSPLQHLLLQLVIAASALIGLLFVCRRAFGLVLSGAARTRATDLFLLTVLLLAMGTAYTVHLAGLAAPIGAFLAGMAIGESDFRHQIEGDVRPFRDVLVGLFFVTIGLDIDPSLAAKAPLTVLFWLLVLVPGKFLAGMLVGTILRWPPAVAVRVAAILAHGGEFGLLLLTQATQNGLVESAVSQPVLLAVAIAMGLGPILIQRADWFAARIAGASHRLQLRQEADAVREASRDLDDHVVVAGCGSVGRLVVSALERAGLAYVAIESDHTRFRDAQRAGLRVLFGDAGSRPVLAAAALDRARFLVVTFDRSPAINQVLHHARGLARSIEVIVSADDESNLAALIEQGAAIVYVENVAAGLVLADQVLLHAGLTQVEAARVITALREQLHPELVGRVGDEVQRIAGQRIGGA